MKKIKVLQIISNMGAGGAQRIVLNYLNKFNNDDNIEVKLLVLGSKTNSCYDTEIAKNKYDVQYLNIKNKKIPFVHRFVNFNFNNSLILKAINKYNPDIIHVHLFGTLKSLSGIFDKCNTKMIFYTLHSNPERFTGLDLRIAKKVFSLPNFVPVCLNEEQLKIAKKHYGKAKYEIAYNGVDFQKIKSEIINKNIARKKFNVNENNYLISTVGRLDPIKNYSFLLDVFNEVTKLNKDALLVFAGDGNEMEMLKLKAENLKIDNKVIFLGNIDNCTELYCASDAFVLTSISETTSLVFLEAQACNTYCVISKGVPDESIITSKVKKMNENASILDWAKALLNNNYKSKPVLKFDNYEIDQTINNIKKMYFKYSGDSNEQ